MKARIVRVAQSILPKGSRAWWIAKRVAVKLRFIYPNHIDPRYTEWIQSGELFLWSEHTSLEYEPLVSVVVPVFNVATSYLREAVYSVVNQTYNRWELILVNASTDKKCREETTACALVDDRIRVVEVRENLGIAGNTNIGAREARGEYIALLDNDDVIAPQALYELVRSLQGKKRPDIVYSDEDKITDDSQYRFDPVFKPAWTLHMLRQVNYFNHLTIFKNKLFQQVGGYRSGFEGAQDYDLYLRMIDTGAVVGHVAKILYHWRAVPSSTAADFSSKAHILDAGIRALKDHLRRNRLKGVVKSLEKQPGFYTITYAQDKKSEIAIVVSGSKSQSFYAEYIRNLMDLVAHNREKNITVYVQNLKANKRLQEKYKGMLVNIEQPTERGFLKEVEKKSKATTFVLLRAALLWEKKSKWLNRVAGLLAECDDVHIVSPLIVRRAQGAIYDAGSVRIGDSLERIFIGYPEKAYTPIGNTNWVRTLDGISGRCVVVRRDIFRELARNEEVLVKLDEIVRGRKGVLLYPQASLDYRGDFGLRTVEDQGIMPMLTTTSHEIYLGGAIYFPSSGEDNA